MRMSDMDRAATGEGAIAMPEGKFQAALVRLDLHQAVTSDTFFAHFEFKVVSGPNKGESYTVKSIIKTDTNLEIFTSNLAALSLGANDMADAITKIESEQPLVNIDIAHAAPFVNLTIVKRLERAKPARKVAKKRASKKVASKKAAKSEDTAF